MKFSDLLRKLADVMDGEQNPDNSEKVMMPPQTQELELAKKQAGVPSQFDNQPEEEADCGCGESDDTEITDLKRLAGIKPSKD